MSATTAVRAKDRWSLRNEANTSPRAVDGLRNPSQTEVRRAKESLQQVSHSFKVSPCGLVIGPPKVIVDLYCIEHRIDKRLTFRVGKPEIYIKEPAQVPHGIKVAAIKSFDRMREFRAIDCQHEDDIVHGEQVLGDLKEFDSIRRATSVQLIDYHDERVSLLRRQFLRHVLQGVAEHLDRL